MEIQTNHNLILLNAKCEYVCIVDNLSKKLDYGDDIECCLNKLYLASKLINRLECYNFPIITNVLNVNSEFIPNLSFYNPDYMLEAYNLTIQLNVNGTIYTLVSDGVNDGFNLIVNKLTELGVLVSYLIIMIDKVTELRLELTCNISNISFTVQYGGEFPSECLFINSTVGVCPSSVTTTTENCIEESNLREMYSVLDNLLS